MAQTLTQSVAPGERAKPIRERRRSQRQNHVVSAWLSSEAGAVKSPQHQVLVFNLSLHGVGFRTDTRFEKGTVFWMVVGAGPLHLSSRLRIASCRPRTDGTFDVGGEFF